MSASLSTFSGRKVPTASRNAFVPKRRVVSRQMGTVRVQAKKVAVLGAGAPDLSELLLTDGCCYTRTVDILSTI